MWTYIRGYQIFIYLLSKHFYDSLCLGKSTKFGVWIFIVLCLKWMNLLLCFHNINCFVKSGSEESNTFFVTYARVCNLQIPSWSWFVWSLTLLIYKILATFKYLSLGIYRNKTYFYQTLNILNWLLCLWLICKLRD